MIVIGCDHGGYELKEEITAYLKEKNIEFKDFGIYSAEPADYPDIALRVCEAVVNGECEKAILICGTGIGMSIAANKVKGIRCALCGDVYSAKMTRLHNDSNVLALGGRVIGKGLCVEIIEAWLGTEFSGEERHINRIRKVMSIE